MSVLYQVAKSVYIINKVGVPDCLVASNDKDGRLRVRRGEILFIIICFSLESAKLRKNRKPRKHNETIFAATAYKCEKKHIYCCFFTTRLTFSKQNTVYVKTFLFICID